MKTALVLIDLQSDFLQPWGRLKVGEQQALAVIRCASRLISAAPQKGMLPVFVANQFRPDDWIGNILRKHSALKGSKGAEIDPRIPGPALPLFPKEKSDAFSNADLNRYLQSNQITNLLIAGVMTEACVRATTAGAIQHGYQVTVVSDGVESDKHWKKAFGLWWMRRLGAHIQTCDETLARRDADAQTLPQDPERLHA
ncbi:MAG: isochorismatase family cysteine hydrolase [Gallionellaceae bacterium]